MKQDTREDLKINATNIKFDNNFHKLKMMKLMIGRRLKQVYDDV